MGHFVESRKKNDMKVFITGGLGFLGGRLSRYLSSIGYNVIIGSRRASNLAKPIWLKQGKLCSYSTTDSIEDLEKKLNGIDVVIHAAGPNEAECARDPEHAIEDNAVGMYRLCEAAKLAKVDTLLFFSTAHVYGSPLSGSFTELSIPEPKHPYAYSRRAAEDILFSFQGKIGEGIPRCITIRLTNSFGAPERVDVNCWTLLVADLCRQAVETGTLILKSDGMGMRDFICISDVERAVQHLIAETPSGKFLYNLGAGQGMTILGMAEKIADEAARLLGKSISISAGPSRPSEKIVMSKLIIDTHRIRATGYKVSGDIGKEIRDLLQFCLHNLT